MPAFDVLLQMTLHGCAVGSTDDVFDADTAEDAERLALEAWRAVEPPLRFLPLLTLELR